MSLCTVHLTNDRQHRMFNVSLWCLPPPTPPPPPLPFAILLVSVHSYSSRYLLAGLAHAESSTVATLRAENMTLPEGRWADVHPSKYVTACEDCGEEYVAIQERERERERERKRVDT